MAKNQVTFKYRMVLLQAKLSYVSKISSVMLPVEVKSGTTGRLKSLRVFMDEKKLKIGIRISPHNLSFHDGILSLPFYMIHELPRILAQL